MNTPSPGLAAPAVNPALPGSRETLADTSMGAPNERPRELVRGTIVDRYVVLDRIGKGGMGVVFAAYDPELDRKVALKLLHSAGGPTGASAGATRLLREAQALARLSHPAVVTVYDVGQHAGAVWLAMELVVGTTLTTWSRAARRGWREALPVILRAGEGLAAAHAAGLVHRDFKPDNVMVADDGRVVVMDFGLARVGDTGSHSRLSTDASPRADGTRPHADALGTELTIAGSLLGTPAYMAPEQHLGEPIDARTDQFAFCVMAWEVLTGERPFEGDTVAALAFSVTRGQVRSPQTSVTSRGMPRMPSWLRRILLRGLSVERDARFATMADVLSALARGRARERTRRLSIAGAAVGLAAVAAVAADRIAHERAIATCERMGAEIERIWPGADAAASERLRATLSGSFDQTRPWIDAFADEWRSVRDDACTRATVTEEVAPELAARAEQCLEERHDEFAALVDVLVEGGSAVRAAIPALAALERPAACADPDALPRREVLPPADREREHQLRRRLFRASGLESVGRFAEAQRDAEAVAAEGTGLPVEIDALRVAGAAASRAGDYARSERLLEDAYFAAIAAGSPLAAARAASWLTQTVGLQRQRIAEGLRWGRHAETLLRAAAADDGLDMASILSTNAALESRNGRHDDAMRMHEQAIAIRTRILGADHPLVGMAISSVVDLECKRGNYDHAAALAERVIEIAESALGPDHPSTVYARITRANVDLERGRPAPALRVYETGLAELERILGPDHPEVATTLNNLGITLTDLGDLDAAERMLTRALTMWERVHGPEHADVALALGNLARVYQARGDFDRAVELSTRSAAVWERTMGPDHPDLAMPLVGLCELGIARGRPTEAMDACRRAVEIRSQPDIPADHVGEAKFLLAKALWATPRAQAGDRAEARELAQEAAADLARGNEPERSAAAALWLTLRLLEVP